jgi:hypothetical protein
VPQVSEQMQGTTIRRTRLRKDENELESMDLLSSPQRAIGYRMEDYLRLVSTANRYVIMVTHSPERNFEALLQCEEHFRTLQSP